MALARLITAPPLGAAALRVAVAVELFPPTRVVGLRIKDERGEEIGVTVSCAVCVAPYTPEIVTAVELETALVVTVKVPLVALAATVTLGGTCAAAVLLLDRVTTAPVEGAGAESVTVPIVLLPPTTEFGFTASEASDDGALLYVA